MANLHEFIDRVQQQTDIVQLIAQSIKLNDHNMGLCPFHHDTQPSLSVDQVGQYFHCFGCGRGGDSIRFLELSKDMPFMEALHQLAKESGLELPEVNPEELSQIASERLRQVILEETALYHHQQLSQEAKAYLTARGFDDGTILKYRLGYGDGSLSEHLLNGKKFDVESCLQAGVIVRDGTSLNEYFAGRIVFPNIVRGRPNFLSGRVLVESEPRYIHLKAEDQHLYNEDALRCPSVVLTRGIPDCLSVLQAGHPAVGLLGTSSFKPEYVSRFSQCETVYVAMGNDPAGQEAAARISSMLGRKARIVQVPVVKDLNEFLKNHTPEEFRELLQSSKDIIRHRLYQIPQDTDKVELSDQLDPLLRDLATMERPQAEAYLGHDIKQRFDLNNADVTAYRMKITELRKELDPEKPAFRSGTAKGDKMTASFDGLVDLVDDNGNPAFLVKENGSLAIHQEVIRDGETLLPPPRDSITWLLPKGAEVLRHYADAMAKDDYARGLYTELVEYHKAISELPSEDYYGFLACWDMHTYLLEQAQYSPIICFSSLPARGKTRTGKGLIYVAFRGVYEQSLREANIFRFSDNFKGAMFFDIRDFRKKVELCQSEDLFLSRFEKGGKISRVLFPDRGAFEDTRIFNVFGPTIICTNEPIDDILESRTIMLNMRDAVREFHNDVCPELALPLRTKLLAFRAKYFDSPLPVVTDKPASSRLGDILRPIQQVLLLVNPNGNEQFLEFVTKLENERKTITSVNFDAQVLRAVIELRDRVVHGALAAKDVTEKLNVGRVEKFNVSPQRVGRMLRSMGFTPARTENGASAYIWDETVIDGLKRRYGM